ncbi:MAG TPA: RimK/LysX family protein [Polyangia bacterium]
MERRPVIETALQLGPLKKRIAVTLTNRGEMLFPMLIGRTALGPGITVDPSRRYLVSS